MCGADLRPVLLINGPCGVGKTTLAGAVAGLLTGPRAVFDLDALTQVFPRPAGDAFGQARALRLLGRMLPELPADCPLILAHVWEDDEDLAAVHAALPGAVFTHIVLTAPVAVLHARLVGRERGPALDWHRDRALVLDETLRSGPSRDLTLDTAGSDPEALAHRVLRVTGWPVTRKDIR